MHKAINETQSQKGQDLLLKSNWKHNPTNLATAFLSGHTICAAHTKNIFLKVIKIKPFWFLQLGTHCTVQAEMKNSSIMFRVNQLILEMHDLWSFLVFSCSYFEKPLCTFWYNFSLVQINDPALQRFSCNLYSGYRSPWIQINLL